MSEPQVIQKTEKKKKKWKPYRWHSREWLTNPSRADSYFHCSIEHESKNWMNAEFKLSDCTDMVCIGVSGDDGIQKIDKLIMALEDLKRHIEARQRIKLDEFADED